MPLYMRNDPYAKHNPPNIYENGFGGNSITIPNKSDVRKNPPITA